MDLLLLDWKDFIPRERNSTLINLISTLIGVCGKRQKVEPRRGIDCECERK